MPEIKEEVVISGIGGRFPECNDMEELKELLFNKTNGVTIDSRRWNPNKINGIDGTGKLKNIDKFDSTFFSAHPKLAESMDPLTRICLERSIEAIIDAGLSPSDLYGTNTAVFTGSAISVTEMYTLDCSEENSGFSMLGRSRTMQANRVSYILNLTGPSFSMDGGWICGANGLKKAKEMIESGIISSAIVGVTGLILRPEIQLQFQGLNRLNKSNQTKSFSSDADGYNRSEACIVMLLQRASEAKRSYATLLSVKSLAFGDHQGHLTEHFGNNFKSILLDSYKEANIDPASMEFIEAYGSGIKCEDEMELNIMEEVFCTEKRQTPLKVGSIKSNIGHCEVSGHFISIVKAIIALESGYIPPNINYTEPNENVPSLKNGKIQVVTEKTPLVTDVVGISSFGLMNAFSHVIIKKNSKVHNDFKDNNREYDIPQLILVSGRNEENVEKALEKIKSYGKNPEYVALTNGVFTKNIAAHFYRSFSIFPSPEKSQINEVWNVNLKKRPVWFIFSGMGSQWQGMGADLMRLPIFSDAIEKCDSILKPLGVDIKYILTSQETNVFDNILNSFVGIAAVQIGLVEVLKSLDITPDGIIGHSVGELGCAYADGCFTAEEMILAAYARGRASLETDFIPGMMAAIGLGYDQIKDKLPHDIDVACRNSSTSCTISGPVESINEFVSQLKSEGVFAKSVNVAGIAFHSRYIQSAGPTLLKYLKDVIKVPKKRSSKWVSSSLPETEWESDLAKYSSPEYHTNNLLSSVLFEDVLKHIPSDAITIEIAPHGLLQAIIKGALSDTVTNISLTKRIFGDSIQFLLTALGKMYASGLNPKIQNIYPPMKFPVRRGTPHIHSLPFWDHTGQWIITVAKNSHFFPGEKINLIFLNEDIYLMEYRIHGYHIIPFSYVLINVWKMYVEMFAKSFSEEPVQFHNLQFKNNVKIHPTNLTEFYIMIQWGSGLFEYSLNDEVIFSGQVNFINKFNLNAKPENFKMIDKTSDDFQGCVSKEELYVTLKNDGYNLGENFKNIMNFEVYKNNIQGSVTWENDWIYFLDGLLKFPILGNVGTHQLEGPVSIRQITINPTEINKYTIKDNISINHNIITNEITCDGVQICDVKNEPITLSKLKSAEIKLEEQQFIPFNYSNFKNISDIINDFMNIITESFKLNLDHTSEKLVLYTPFHFDDPLSKECIKSIKQVMENQIAYDCMILNWNSVDKISENYESGKFITVTNVNYLQNTMNALANKKCSYIIVSSLKKLQDIKEWKIITQQKLNNDSYLSLMKKAIIRNGNSKFIKPINDKHDLSIWKALETCSTTSMIYIISKYEPLEGINTYVKKLLLKYKSNKLRFVFILDSNAPDFDSHQSFYTDQLSKDLIVNIYKNGVWGSYKRSVLQDLKHNTKVNKNQVFKNCIINTKVKYLGLNFKELVVEENSENEFGPLEYSGYFDNKTTMGITSLNDISSQLFYDPLLSWPVPSTWSLQDAATVPLAYAMSYYVLNILSKLQKNKSVLVTSGLHPIGQAAISICLNMKCETYAIVDSEQQADQLSYSFPELSRSKIIINKNNKFDVPLKIITKSKGVDITLNFLSGESFYAAIRAISKHGKLFSFSNSDMKKQKYLGIRIFLQDISFFAVSSTLLLNESVENKQIVQQAFMDGLNKGVIKPFKSYVLTPPFSIEPILNDMRNALATSNKIVLSLNDDVVNSKIFSEHDSYQFHPDHVYVVVGNKSDWLDVTEWLVDRGAQKIVIVVECCLMSSTTYRNRFAKLISRNISVQIESFLYLKTKKESLEWLTRLASSSVLGSLFIVNQHDDIIINNLWNAFEDLPKKTKTTWLICISSKGEHICAELKSKGLNALNILWDKNSTQINDIEKLLIALDNILQKSSSIESSSFICSESSANKLEWSHQINDVIANFFPESTKELHLLYDKITKEAEFIEVPTRSPRSSQMKSVIPVFVIPGLKPKLIETFYRQFYYPVFEAQYPNDIISIDNISEILVDKLKSITDRSYVSIIGESWGGIIALKMAQILELQGTLVTVTLLEGDPEYLTGWAEKCLSSNNITNKLNSIYSSFTNENVSHNCAEVNKIPNESYLNKSFEDKTKQALNIIRSRLQVLLESKPLLNKLHTKVLIVRYERMFEFYLANLNEYCTSPSFVHIIPKMDYKSMMADKETIDAITNNVVISYPDGIELPLIEKYNNFYLNIEKFLKYIG